jgi:hypothetical protein
VFVSKIAQWGVRLSSRITFYFWGYFFVTSSRFSALILFLLYLIRIFKMRSILLFVLLTNGILAFSQTISKQVIGLGGQTFETGSYKLSYTTGEVAIGTMSSEDETIQLGNGYYPSFRCVLLGIKILTIDSLRGCL